MYLQTALNYRNQLSYATGLENVQVHSVITARPNRYYTNASLYFVLSVDVTGHPNITDGNATCYMYMTLNNIIVKGDGTLEIDYNSNYIFSVYTSVYIGYDAINDTVLSALYEPIIFPVSQ